MSLPPSTEALEQSQAASYTEICDKMKPHMRFILPARMSAHYSIPKAAPSSW